MSQVIVKLKPGVQAPPVIASNTIYIPDGGLVTFNAPIKLGNKADVTFDGSGIAGLKYGFLSTAIENVFDSGVGNNQRIKIKAFDFGATASQVFDANTKIYPTGDWVNILTYNGKPETAVYSDLQVEDFALAGSMRLLYGTYEATRSYRMVVLNPSFKNGVCKSKDPIQFFGMAIFGLHIDGFVMDGPTNNAGDAGVLYMTGTASMKNIYHNGPWGYIARLIIAKLGGVTFDQTCEMKNCIDVNTTHYGTLDIRLETGSLASNAPIPLTGGDFTYQHNTSGDKKDDGGYITNAVVMGIMTDDLGKKWNVIVKDSIAWNAMVSGLNGGSTSLLKNNSSGQLTPIVSNNVDLPAGVPIPAGYFVDMHDFVPAPGSPLIGKASDGTDIGAKQHVVVPPTPPKPRTVIKAQFWYDDGTVSFLPLT